MLQQLRRGAATLPDPQRTVAFLRGCIGPDGGFRGRGEQSDVYFTVFGVEALMALRGHLPRDALANFLRGFGPGDGLDLVHLACLARCWADLPDARPGEPVRQGMIGRLESFCAADGGYAPTVGGQTGTAYACFLAAGALQDLGAGAPDAAALARCITSLRTPDGAYANAPSIPMAATPSTAAAVLTLRAIGQAPDPGAGDWLLARCGRDGGFRPVQGALMGDLLSTAVALHALDAIGADVGPIRDRCRRFVLDRRRPDGSFCAAPSDQAGDCEYTWYALLALAHVAA